MLQCNASSSIKAEEPDILLFANRCTLPLPLLRVAHIAAHFLLCFLASQGAPEVMLVTHSLTIALALTFSDVTLLNEDTYGEDEGNGDENV